MKRATFAAILLGGAAFLPSTAWSQTAPAEGSQSLDPAASTPAVPAAGTPTTTPPAAVTPASPQGDSGLTDIIVTAQRTASTAQRTAVALDVIAPEAVQQITEPQSLTKLAPGVQFGNAGGASPVFYVRGVGTITSLPFIDSAVAINFDEVYLGRATSAFGLYYDLDRIEVLKGPQGTLYGRNATGGAINIVPAQPRLGLNEVSGTISVGNYEAANAQAAVNVAVSDKIALRASGIAYTHAGYQTDGTYSERGAGGRLQALFKPSEAVSIRLAGDYFHLGGTLSTGVVLGSTDPQTGAVVPSNLGPDVGQFDPRTVSFLNSAFSTTAGAAIGALTQRPYSNSNFYGVSAHVDADLGGANLAIVGAYRGADLDYVSSIGSFSSGDQEKDDQYSIEARLNGKVGPFDWLVGGLYFNEKVNADVQVNQIVLGVNQRQDFRNISYAGFGSLKWNLTDTLRITGAGRYTQDIKKFDGSAYTATAICTSPTRLCPNIRRLPSDVSNLPAVLNSLGYVQFAPNTPFVDVTGTSNVIWSASNLPVTGRQAPSKFTYRGAIEFEPRPESLLYASVETGYRSGGFSFSSIAPQYGPETITAYTIGAKNRFFGNKLQLNLEGFIWKYKNQQVTHIGFSAARNVEYVTENIGQSTNKGFEVDMTARPLRNTTLHADVQYLDARNDDFVFTETDPSALAGLPAGTIPSVTNCPRTVVPNTGLYQINCSGLRAQRSPTWTLNLGAEQAFDLSSDYRLILAGNTHFQTSSIVNFERRAFGIQDSYWLSDASLTLAAADDSWSIGAFVNNIEDTRVKGITSYLASTGTYQANYAPPRTYGMRLGFRIN